VIFEGWAHEGGRSESRAQQGCRASVTRRVSGHGIFSCAVSGDRNGGGPGALGVESDRFDHQVQFIGAIDFARHAIGLARQEVVGFGEVM